MTEQDDSKLHDQKELAFCAAAVQAWVATRMEKDRTILGLSTAGIGLLTTLLTSVGPSSGFQLALYSAAGLSFIVAIVCAVVVFDRNADHLRDVLKDQRKGDDPRLQRLDWVLFLSFLLGVVLTGVVAVSAGFSHLGAKR